MRLLGSVATLATVLWSPPTANAFVPPSTARGPISPRASGGDDRSQTVCDIPTDFGKTPSLVGVSNGADAIRSAAVINSAGDFVRVDDAIKSGRVAANAPQVVVYLRHMGWPYCWSYAREWCSIQPRLAEAGVGGPIFVSIGDADKLNTFLDANDWMGRDQMFVDDYSFGAYRAAGFGRFDQVDKETVKNIKMTAPELGGFREWMNYFSIVGKVSPVPKDLKFGEVPEGVLWTGGTFVIQDNDVLYQWTDTVPGNHPVVEEIVEIAEDAARNKKRINLPGKVGWF